MTRRPAIDFSDPPYRSVVLRPTILLSDASPERRVPQPSAADHRRLQLQRLLDEPLTRPLGSMMLSGALRATKTPQARAREPAPRRNDEATEEATAPARPARRRAPPASAFAARATRSHAPSPTPAAARPIPAHWQLPHAVRNPHPPRAAASRDAWPFYPDARPARRHAHHRASAHGAWTWPVALSLCSMLIAYAITARMLSRAALEHSNAPAASLACE